MTITNPTLQTDVLSRSEAAAYLRVCKTTLDRLDIPRTQIRRRVLFKRAVLDKWLDEHTAHPAGAAHPVGAEPGAKKPDLRISK
jgi:excisionase family DNA binding protein